MSLLMWFHVVTGSVAVTAGMLALFAPKGRVWHRRAGQVFVVSMLLMASAGALIAWFRPMMISVLAGVFTCYLVISAWRTLHQTRMGWADALQIGLALAVVAAGLRFGLEAQGSADGLKDGYAAADYFFFVGLAALASVLDLVMWVKGGVSGQHRLARHLWRMSFALFIAAGSLFTGPGAKLFPKDWQGSAWLSLPEVLVLLTMLFYLGHMVFKRLLARRRLTSP